MDSCVTTLIYVVFICLLPTLTHQQQLTNQLTSGSTNPPKSYNSFNSTSPLALPINQFSLKFYRSVSNLSENVFFSPLSISMMYSMLLRGSSGLTAQQIINAFEYQLNFKTSDDVHDAFKEVS